MENKYDIDEDYLLLWEDEEGDSLDDTDQSKQDSSDSSVVSTQKKRKRSKVPRIVKNDIRRQYVRMIGNVFNGSEINYFYSFFQTFCIDQMIFKKSCLSSFSKTAPAPSTANTINRITDVRDDVIFQNIHRMSCEWYLLHHLIPDEILTIRDAKILTWPGNKRSVVVIDVACEFTRVFNVNPKKYLSVLFDYYERRVKEIEEGAGDVIGPGRDSTLSASHIASVIPDPFSAYFEMTGEHVPISPLPVRTKFITEFRLLLDETKSIEMMEIAKTTYVPVDSV